MFDKFSIDALLHSMKKNSILDGGNVTVLNFLTKMLSSEIFDLLILNLKSKFTIKKIERIRNWKFNENFNIFFEDASRNKLCELFIFHKF